MKHVKITVSMNLDREDGAELSAQDANAIAAEAAEAIRQRLIGQGFAPADVYVDDFQAKTEVGGL